MYFAGAECGGTKTTVAILDVQTGSIVWHRVVNAASNAFVAGTEVVAKIIADAIADWRREHLDAPAISGLGVTAAGVEPGAAGASALISSLDEAATKLAVNGQPLWTPGCCIAMNDSVGAGFILGNEGGCVLIAGTGSAGRVVTPTTEIETDKGSHPSPRPGVPLGGLALRVGGWGHLVGDEGSAWHLAHAAVSSLWRVDDGVKAPGDPTVEAATAVRAAVYKRFGISHPGEADDSVPATGENADRNTIFDAWSGATGWCKGVCAALTADIAGLAAQDTWARELVEREGAWIGRNAGALVRKWKAVVDGDASECSILAVGSVWKSFPIFARQFAAELPAGIAVRLVRPADDAGAAAAAAWRAALHAGVSNPTLLRDGFTSTMAVVEPEPLSASLSAATQLPH